MNSVNVFLIIFIILMIVMGGKRISQYRAYIYDKKDNPVLILIMFFLVFYVYLMVLFRFNIYAFVNPTYVNKETGKLKENDIWLMLKQNFGLASYVGQPDWDELAVGKGWASNAPGRLAIPALPPTLKALERDVDGEFTSQSTELLEDVIDEKEKEYQKDYDDDSISLDNLRELYLTYFNDVYKAYDKLADDYADFLERRKEKEADFLKESQKEAAGLDASADLKLEIENAMTSDAKIHPVVEVNMATIDTLGYKEADLEKINDHIAEMQEALNAAVEQIQKLNQQERELLYPLTKSQTLPQYETYLENNINALIAFPERFKTYVADYKVYLQKKYEWLSDEKHIQYKTPNAWATWVYREALELEEKHPYTEAEVAQGTDFREHGYLYLNQMESLKIALSSDLYKKNEDKISKSMSRGVFTSDYILRIIVSRNEIFLLPIFIALMIPAMFFLMLYLMFIHYAMKSPQTYLFELRNINRFTSFLNYSIKFNNNPDILLKEALKGVDEGYFYNETSRIVTSTDVSLEDKLEEIYNMFNFQFLKVYLTLFQIMIKEGVTESGIQSIELAQFQGEKYYKNIDKVFEAKLGALKNVRFIILILLVLVPILVKRNVPDLYLMYIYSDSGYTLTIFFFAILFGILCFTVQKYSSIKLIREEGRYV